MNENDVSAKHAALPPEATLMPLLCGGLVQQCIRVAARLHLADLVAAQPRTAQELARETGTHAPSLYRMLRLLASIGIFSEQSDGRFILTPMASLLQSDVPNSLRDFAIMQGEPWNWQGVGALEYAIETGNTAQGKVHGAELFEYLANHPEDEALFIRAMTSYSLAAIPTIAASYDFSSIGTLADIGGGHGILLAGILRAYPHLKGILFDLPSVVGGAGPLLQQQGVADRVTCRAGNFFEAVPSGADACILKNILHDWNDPQCVTLLRHIHAALPSSGRLLVVELVVPEGDAPGPAKFVDMQMLVTVGGRERTCEEFADLFAAGGFQLTQVVPTRSPMVILEAERR